MVSRRRSWQGAVAVVVLAAALVLVLRSREGRPHVLLITVDTLRADRLGCYGFPLARTPHADALAADGVLFRDAITVAPITLPSHASLFTGVYPPAHGVRDNGAYALGEEAVTLAERLKEAGYATQAFVSAMVLNRRYNLTQGFDGYDDDLWSEDSPRLFMIRERRAEKTAARFLDWFSGWKNSRDRQPFFAWVHFFDPHQPYDPPASDRALSPTAYDAEIAVADRGVGRIIGALRDAGVLEDTIVVLTADHGESLGEHQEKTHALFIYDATVRVPLIVRYPRALPSGEIYEGPVRTVDVVPTLLDLLDLPGAGETQGVSLLAALRGESAPPELPQYAESLLSELGFGMAPLYGVRKDGYKWIRAPRPELYDLRNDPGELENLYPREASRGRSLDRALEEILRESEKHATPAAENPITRETQEMLQSLGYLAPGEDRKSMGGMDPKDGIEIYNKLEEARHFARRAEWTSSEKLLRDILKVLPAHLSARNTLGLVLLRQSRWEESRDQYLRSLAVDPEQARVLAALGSVALMEGDLEEARRHLEKALELTPDFVEAMCNLGFVELLAGNEDAAERWYEKAIAADPGFPRAYRRYADFFYERGEYESALVYYRKTLEIVSGDFRALVQAGNSARHAGDAEQAYEYYHRAASLRPDSWIPPYNLACLMAVTGKAEEAIEFLEQALGRNFRSPELLETDGDLAALRDLPSFRAIVEEVRRGRKEAREI